jgi:hypothetical protein
MTIAIGACTRPPESVIELAGWRLSRRAAGLTGGGRADQHYEVPWHSQRSRPLKPVRHTAGAGNRSGPLEVAASCSSW